MLCLSIFELYSRWVPLIYPLTSADMQTSQIIIITLVIGDGMSNSDFT